MRRSRRLLAAAAVSALLVSCTDGGDEITLPSPSPTTTTEADPSPTAAATTPTPTPSDAFAVPEEITADYVERVLNEINRIDAEITKDILRSPVDETATELPAEYRDRLQTIYVEPIVTFNSNAKVALIQSEEERADLLPVGEYGHLRTPVEEVLDAESCLIVRVVRDYSEVDAVDDTDTSDIAFFFLVRRPDLNPTGWAVAGLVGSDAAPGSDDEEELRTYTANDLTEFAPESCA